MGMPVERGESIWLQSQTHTGSTHSMALALSALIADQDFPSHSIVVEVHTSPTAQSRISQGHLFPSGTLIMYLASILTSPDSFSVASMNFLLNALPYLTLSEQPAHVNSLVDDGWTPDTSGALIDDDCWGCWK